MIAQREYIKHMLLQHKVVTQREADRECGCTRLAARIWELKRQGMNIESTMVPVKTRHGKAMVAAYRMVE